MTERLMSGSVSGLTALQLLLAVVSNDETGRGAVQDRMICEGTSDSALPNQRLQSIRLCRNEKDRDPKDPLASSPKLHLHRDQARYNTFFLFLAGDVPFHYARGAGAKT